MKYEAENGIDNGFSARGRSPPSALIFTMRGINSNLITFRSQPKQRRRFAPPFVVFRFSRSPSSRPFQLMLIFILSHFGEFVFLEYNSGESRSEGETTVLGNQCFLHLRHYSSLEARDGRARKRARL